MPPRPDAFTRLAVQRYRARLFVLRVTSVRPKALDLVDRVLTVIGAWSVIFALLRSLPFDDLEQEAVIAGAAAIVVGLWLIWIRLARRPQDVFRAAAASESLAEELRRFMSLGMRNQTAYDCLVRLYRPLADQIRESGSGTVVDWPVDVDGRQCLVLTLAADPTEVLDDLLTAVTAPRDHAWQRRVSEFAPERQMYMAALRRSAFFDNKFGDEEGANLVLDKIDCADRLVLTTALASYGQIVRTSDALINEFALFAHLLGRSAFRKKPRPLQFRGDQVLEVLPWRREVHSWDHGTDVLLEPRGRAAGLSVSMALADREGPHPCAYTARRSSSVGTYPNVPHVIPSGMINVHGEVHGHQREALAALPRLTMMAEFLEECFDVEELAGHAVGNFAARVDRELRVRGLQALTPEFTGVAIDLLNLRSEICAVLDLGRYRTAVDNFVLSWEYTRNDPLRTTDLERGAGALDRTDFVQSGIGCLHLASSCLAGRG